MGVVTTILDVLFGGQRNVLRDTVEVFRENSEAGAARAQITQATAMAQFGAEFNRPNRGWFDRLMDGVNRLPRPLMALGCLCLFGTAMVDPVWFAARMQGIALVPEPLWWLLGVIVSFYFGARHQAKNQDLQREWASGITRTAQVLENLKDLNALEEVVQVQTPEANAALAAWRATQ